MERELQWLETRPVPDWNVAPDAVLWIDVGLFDACWARTDQWISPFGKSGAQANRYADFGDWVAKKHAVLMPEVVLDGQKVTFTNGRHRFAWLRDHGVLALPVQIDPDDAAQLQLICGSPLRRSLLGLLPVLRGHC